LTRTVAGTTIAAMYLGIVKGTVVAERKAAGLEGKKLLLVQPVDEHGAPVGDVQAAVDTVQAGDGDLVYLVGSREAALACDPWFVPVDAAIVGIVDGIDAPAPSGKVGP
jgi:ethanolamine utilization protein EutN